MKNERIISALLASVLVCTAASCGGDGPSDGTTADSGTSQTQPTVESEYQKPDVNYKGETITVASYSYSGPWQILNYNVALHEENADVINDAIVKRNRTVEDELGVNIELMTLTGEDRGNSNVLQKLILAMDDTFQFALPMSAGIAPMLTTEGMLVDLKTIPTLDLSKSWWNQNANDEFTLYGKQLAAVGDICFFNLGAPIVTFFSKGMIEDNKLEDPYELVESGKWTIDKLTQMSTDVSRDLDGNTIRENTDQFGFSGEYDSFVYMMLSGDVRISEHTANGDIKLVLNSERTVNMVEKLATLFRNADISRINNVQVTQYPSYHADYAIPKLEQKEILFLSFQLLGAINMRASNNDFGILPTPKYDESQENYVSFANSWFSDHLIVPSTNTKLEMTGHVIDAMGYYAQQFITPAYIETTVLGKSIRDDQSAEMIDLILETQVFDVAYIFNWGNIRSSLGQLSVDSESNFTTVWAKVSTRVQTALDKTVEQLKG